MPMDVRKRFERPVSRPIARDHRAFYCDQIQFETPNAFTTQSCERL